MSASSRARRSESSASSTSSWVVVSSGGDPGHVFIRRGIEHLIRSTAGGVGGRISIVDKHASWDVPERRRRLRRRFRRAKAVVLAMGPFAWPFVERSTWTAPLLEALHEASGAGVPVCALAIGACYGLDADLRESAVRPEEVAFLRQLLSHCSLVTARDRLAQRLAREAGRTAPLLPCVALCAFPPHLPAEGHPAGGMTLINYMRQGGHHDYFNRIDPRRWRRTVAGLVAKDRGLGLMGFLCHSPAELELAPLIAPGLPAFMVRGPADLVAVSARARRALVSRIHAALGLACLGVPSVTVGTDSRLLCLAELGLPIRLCSEVTTAELVSDLESLRDRLLVENLLHRVGAARHAYLELFREWVSQVIRR